MLQRSTLKFLKDLRQNNNKPWFDEHKPQYQQAKDDFETLVQQLIDGLAKIDPDIRGLQVKDCVFRIYKDVRFSKDKTPYKTNMGAYFSKGGKKSDHAGYYFQLEPGASFLAGGMWMPQAPVLKKVRQEIDYDFTAFEGIVGQKEFIKGLGKVNGDTLKSAPQGYSEDNPAIAYLKLKSLIVNHNISDDTVTQPTLVREILRSFTLMKPFVNFLNRSLDG